jgi:hypothetical protein
VSCKSPQCTAVGLTEIGTAAEETLAEGWNGKKWVIELPG